MKKSNRLNKVLAVASVLAIGGASAMAQSDVASVVTSATSTFQSVAALCVTIGTFFIGYRLVKRAR